MPAPKVEDAPVERFTREQIEALLKACDLCQECFMALLEAVQYARFVNNTDKIIRRESICHTRTPDMTWRLEVCVFPSN